MLFTWDSGFGNNSSGGDGRRAGNAWHDCARGQQIRYVPQRVNRPGGAELMGQTPTTPRAHMQNFLDCDPRWQRNRVSVRTWLSRIGGLPHGRGELSAAADGALGFRSRRDRLSVIAQASLVAGIGFAGIGIGGAAWAVRGRSSSVFGPSRWRGEAGRKLCAPHIR